MAQTVNILPHAEDRKRLLAIVGDRNRPLKHVQRAKIVLYSAERFPVLEVARRAGVTQFQWSASAVSIFKKLAEIPEPNE